MEDILNMAMIQVRVIVLFVFAKCLRPWVLIQEGYESIKLFLLSFPNFCEAIVGVLTLTGIGIYLNKDLKISNRLVYITAIAIAGIFVITQELKIHNLGGNNTYDPNDLIFSLIGLLTASFIVFKLQPKMKKSNKSPIV